MRKHFKFLIPAILVVALIISCAVIFASAEDKVVYVSSTGTAPAGVTLPEGAVIVGPGTVTGEFTDGTNVVLTLTDEPYYDAIAKIKAIVAIPEAGEVYEGTVRSVMPYGAFVEFMPGKDGLLHISEIDWKRFETMEEAGINEGDKLQVKLVEIDPKTGKFKLSRKALIEKPEGYEERERRPRREREPREQRERRPRNDKE